MQTNYDVNPPIGVHGQRIEAYPSAIVTGLASAAVIPVCALVNYDTAATGDPSKSVRIPINTGDVTTLLGVAGMTLWDPTYPEPPYRLGAALPVMRKGRFACVAETALVAHTTPFVRFIIGGAGTYVGALRADADTAKAVAAPYMTVVVGAALGGVSIIEIDI